MQSDLSWLKKFFFVSDFDFAACEKNELYFMALIDILTKYGVKKRTAQAAKTVKHGAGAEISTVHPDQYAKRFLEFLSKCVEWSLIGVVLSVLCFVVFVVVEWENGNREPLKLSSSIGTWFSCPDGKMAVDLCIFFFFIFLWLFKKIEL